jgi:hypothetical protein
MSDPIEWVMTHMPDECSKALARFTDANPRLRGAHWDDCLDSLASHDTYLNIVEPLCEALNTYDPHLVGAIARTLWWAVPDFHKWTDDMRTIAVKATIDDNGGSK